MDNIIFKKYDRYYDGGYTLSFYNALSGVVDFKIKNHTNFYLTREMETSEMIESDFDTFKSDTTLTFLNFGGKYLTFKEANQKNLALSGIYTNYDYYGDYTFNNTTSLSSNFVFEFFPDNVCRLYHENNYKKYYLATDIDNKLNFFTEKVQVSSRNFKYIYSRSNKSIFLFQNITGIPHFIKQSGNNLTLVEMTSSNKSTIYNNPIFINKDIYNDFEVSHNTTYVEYDTDNTIPNDGIIKNLTNNFLLHRENEDTDIIVLKNQLTQDDTFTSGNTLLSAKNIKYYVDEMRNYSSIFNDINSEKDDTLKLNYVFYNKSYKIIPGTNHITAPSNMEPFSKLNINDTKFINSGAFAYPTPEYADKIYRLDTTTNYTDGQTYLCTWLSGSPTSSEKVWVDRYYYPDLISKSLALKNKDTFNITYEDAVEKLIKNNFSITSSITGYNLFDKKSDMVFEPNGKYIYERINSVYFEEESPEITPCQNVATNNDTINYFKQINESGKFTISFYFNGDNTSWSLKSKRNNKNGGVSFTKDNQNLKMEVNLYDPSIDTTTSFTQTIKFKHLQTNFVMVSVDVFEGIGYFFLNNQIIETFKFDRYQFYTKNILFGDIVLDGVDIFSTNQQNIQNFKLSKEFLPSERAYVTPIIDGKNKIDIIYITLPCGMRNSTDSVDYIQSVCNNQTYKSNFVDIYIKNLEISDDVKEEVVRDIKSNISKFVPTTTEINNIKFENYK